MLSRHFPLLRGPKAQGQLLLTPSHGALASGVAFSSIKQALKVGVGYTAAQGTLDEELLQNWGYRVSSEAT